MNKGAKTVSVVLLVVVVAVLIYFLHSANWGRQKFSSENVSVTQLDVSKLPTGFPSDLPLDKSTIVEQKELNYPDKGVVLYSLSYRSALQLEELYSEYQQYFITHGYVISSSSKSSSTMNIEAGKGGDTVSVLLATNSGYNLVSLAVMHHE